MVYEHSNARVCLGNSGAGVMTERVYCYARVHLPHRAKTVVVSFPCGTPRDHPLCESARLLHGSKHDILLKECHASSHVLLLHHATPRVQPTALLRPLGMLQRLLELTCLRRRAGEALVNPR